MPKPVSLTRLLNEAGKAARQISAAAKRKYSLSSDGAPARATKWARKNRKRLYTSTPSAKNPKGRRSRATAVRGVYRGKIKGLRKGAKTNKFARDGYEFMAERNDYYEDSHCVYVGHGTSTDNAYTALWGAVFRALMHKCGIEFANWWDTVPIYAGTPRITLFYSLDQTATELNVDIGLTGTQTFGGILAQLVTSVSAIQLANPLKIILWRRIMIFSDSFSMVDGMIDLMYFNVEFKHYSKMKIQNRTSARKDVGETEGDDDSADNVEAVPLTGKVYEQMEWLNGFNTRAQRSSAPGTSRVNVCADSVGKIYLGSGGLDTDNATNSFRKPPPSYFMGDKIKAKTVKLDPGSVKDIVYRFTAKGGFNVMARKFNQGTANQLLAPFGKAQIFALEKELSIGSEDGTPIRVGFQIDQKYQCVGYTKRALANPVVTINY